MKTYINWLKSRNLSPNTILNYPANVRQYGDKTLDTKNLLDYTKKALKLYEPTSLKNKLAALKSYAKFKKLKANWEKVAQLIPKVQKKFYETISQPELARMKQAKTEKSQTLHERNNRMLDFFFYSGLRVSELVNLRHSDWQGNQLKVHGKGNKVRYVFLPEFLAKLIKPYSDDYLFTTEQNKPLLREWVYQIVRKRAKKAQIKKKITPHTFRRSLATNLYNCGGKLETIQKQLGHSRLDTTLAYIHNDFNTLYQDYSKLFQGSPSQNQSLKNCSTAELLAELSQRSTSWSQNQEAKQKEPERRNYA